MILRLHFMAVVFSLSCIPFFSFSQTATCSFEENHAEMMQSSSYQQQMQDIMNTAQTMMMTQSFNETSGPSYTVPVVFHIIHNNGTGNISDGQVQSQLDRLNAEFAGNPNSSTGASMDIQFCFAQITPDDDDNWADYGSDHPGITRHNDPANSAISTGGHNAIVTAYGFPSDEYLNIYVVVDIDGGTLGYSNFSGQLGAVMEAQVTGDESNSACNCTLLNNYTLGMALVHEIGHFFNLPHPWGLWTGECNEDDFIADTPVTLGPNYFCPTGVNSCPETPAVLDQVENYMDYTYDACKNTYTMGQRCVAHSVIQNNQTVASLVSLQNLIRTGVAGENGCLDPAIDPTPEISNAAPCINESFTVTVFNDMANTIDNWEIVLTNGTSTITESGTATQGNIVATFTVPTEGSYSVNVSITDMDFTPPTFFASFPNVLYATDCQPICEGATWYFSKATNNGQSAAMLDFSNGATALASPALEGSQFGGGTYTYGSCDDGLFFTDGRFVRDANGDYIVNGETTLTINGCQEPNSSQGSFDLQGVIGVPASDEVTVFTITDRVESTSNFNICTPIRYGLSQHTISTSAPATVTSPFPGMQAATNYSFASAITAIPRCDQAGHWIIVKGASDDVDVNQGPAINAEAQILAYPFDGSSLGAPIVSSSGPYTVDPGNTNSWNAFVEASPDGRWLVYSANGSSYIYEFNALTGTATFKAEVDGNITAFSASGDLLYGLSWNVLFQYDFAHFRECCELLPPVEIPVFPASYMQRGPDSKLYLWRSYRNAISVVNTPDELIENGNTGAVNYIAGALSIPQQITNSPGPGVPNFIEASSSEGIDFYCCVTNCNEVSFRAEGCASGYSWDLGNSTTGTGSTIQTTYLNDGVYTVTLTSNTGMQLTKEISIGFPITPEIFAEGNLCISPFMTYNISVPDMEYAWYVAIGGTLNSDPSLPSAEVNWDDPAVGGTICVVVTDPATGCSVEVCFDQEPCEPCEALTVTAEVTPACEDDGTITLTVTGGSGQYIYIWTPTTLSGTPNQTGLPAGSYSVKVMDAQSEDCVGELEIVVPVDPECGGGCEEPISIHYGLSPKPFCYESDDEFTYYYLNIHVPNWSGSQSVDFEFCGEDYEFSIGELIDPYLEVTQDVFELEGFLKVPSGNIPGEVCVSIPICIEGEELCGQFCFDLEECDKECEDWDIDAQVTQTLIGPMSPEPCGIMGQGYNVYYMDFAINVTIPAGMVGDDFSASIWSDVGQMCTTGLIPPGVSNAPITFTIPFSSFYNANNAKHFCFHIKLKNETTYESCVENFCITLELPTTGESPKGGYEGLEGPWKEEAKKDDKDESLDVKGIGKTGEVFVQGVEDGFWNYEIYSITGQFLLNGKLSEEGTQVLNFGQLSSGYYLIRLNNSVTNESQVEQFVKW